MASSSGLEPNAMLLGRYRVEATLGEGSFGTVVRAFDTRLKRTVAIKTLKRALASTDMEQFRSIEERFAREAEAGSRMGISTNLVTVHDLVIEPNHTQYLILEYVRGGTLAERLSHGPLALNDALRITADVARGLQAAHDAGIVHRDVKPANIFLTPDGRAQLGDFGIAQIDDVSGRTHTTVHHPGTPLYMSPEQAQTTGYVRPASDQYSLGLVLFEMITGKAYKRIGERAAAALLESQPAAVINLIEDMTATHPDDRLPSCDHVARQVQTITRQIGQTETQLSAPPAINASQRGASRPPGVPADDGAASSGAIAPPLPEEVTTSDNVNAGTRRVASTTGAIPPSDTAPLRPMPPPLPPGVSTDDGSRGGSGRRVGVIAAVAAVLLIAIIGGTALALRGGGTPVSVTATSQPTGATSAAAAIAATPTTQPTATSVPLVAPTIAPTPVPTSTVVPTAVPTVSPTTVPTAVPATATPQSKIAVFSAGTTNAYLDTVNGDDVVTSFTAGQDVYGFVNFGGALVGKDALEATLVANGTPQPAQSFTLQKSDGFLVFPLGKLGVGDYRLEVRYNGKVAQAADFHVSAAPVVRAPTATPRPNVPVVANPTSPVIQPTSPVAQPTSPVVQPTYPAVATATPRPVIPPTQPLPKP
jgi:serine/threonine protein kinase